MYYLLSNTIITVYTVIYKIIYIGGVEMTHSMVKSKEEANKLMILAVLAGEIMLKSGAEIYRVEDTVIRICKSKKNIKYAEAFIIPTGIFLSIDYENDLITYIKKIKFTTINLNKIDRVNDFSRKFVSEDLDITEGIRELQRINNTYPYKAVVKNIFGAVACGSFALLFGGVMGDAIGSFFATFFALTVIEWTSRYGLTFFIDNILGSAIMSIFSIVFYRIGLGQNVDIMIIGSIMSLVPGVAITNSVRDTMSGDYLSGLSKGLEAIFSAFSIALGVGIILSIF